MSERREQEKITLHGENLKLLSKVNALEKQLAEAREENALRLEQFEKLVPQLESMKQERDVAREALKQLSCPHCGSDVNGNNWKEMAMKLAEAAKPILEWSPVREKGNSFECRYCGAIVEGVLAHYSNCVYAKFKEALSLYSKEKQ